MCGAYFHGSRFLTGENRIFERFGQHGAQFGRNKPNKKFFLAHGGGGSGFGVWEAKSRWSRLNRHDVHQGEYNDLTVGMNWYWTDRTRVMFDGIHPVTSSGTVFGRTASDLLAMRFDFNWSPRCGEWTCRAGCREPRLHQNFAATVGGTPADVSDPGLSPC